MRNLRLLILALIITLVAPTILPAATSPAAAQEGNQVVINAFRVNLRTGPSTQYASLGELVGGDTYNVVAKSPDSIWFKVTGTPFGDGWVRGRHTIFRGDIDSVPFDSGPYGELAPSTFIISINVPAFNQPRGEIIGTVAGRGSQYNAVGRSFDGNWVQIQTSIGTVWVTASSGAFRGFWFNLPITYGESQSTFAPVVDRLIVNTTALNIRTGPEATFVSLGVLRGGEEYPVTAISPDRIWFKVTGTPFGDGWVRGRFTAFRGDIRDVPVDPGPYGAVAPPLFLTSIYIPVYDVPGGAQQGLLAGPGTFLVTGRDFNGGWIRLQSDEYGEVWTQISRGFFRGAYFDVPIIFFD